MKVEVDVLGSTFGLCGRRATLNSNSCRLKPSLFFSFFLFFFLFLTTVTVLLNTISKTTTKSMGILKFSSSAFDVLYLLDNICFDFFFFFFFFFF